MASVASMVDSMTISVTFLRSDPPTLVTPDSEVEEVSRNLLRAPGLDLMVRRGKKRMKGEMKVP